MLYFVLYFGQAPVSLQEQALQPAYPRGGLSCNKTGNEAMWNRLPAFWGHAFLAI